MYTYMKQISYIDDWTTWQKSFSFSITVPVRFSETDMFGHMNNVTAFIYFEQARIEYLKAKGMFGNDEKVTAFPVVADLQCDFLEQIYFDEKITIHVKTDRVGNSSLDLHYMGTKENGDVCLTGRGALVYIDAHTHRAVSIPEHMKQRLMDESYL